MCLSKILRFLGFRPSSSDPEGYRIYQVGRESFVYEEPGRQARIVGQMLIGGDTYFLFRLRDAILPWETPHGTEPISAEEKQAIFDRFHAYMKKLGATFELQE